MAAKKKLSNPVVAVVGATGAVGVELIHCLEQRNFPLSELRLFASARSAGKSLKFRGKKIKVKELTEKSFDGVQIGLFSAGSSTTKKFAKAAVAAGTIIIDNSSAYRMDPEVPLVVPEINPQAIRTHKGIIANPNCSAIISTCQAASGAGAAAMEELRESTRAYLDGKKFTPKVLPHPYAFNAFSHNTKIDPATAHNEEETKVINETRKIFGDPSIAIGITCVRIPVLRAHCVSVTFECENPISPEEVRKILRKAPGVKVVDDVERNYFPMPVDASGQDDILVGRIRRDLSDSTGRSISIFSAGDQLRKGAALNAVQIAERLVG